MQEEIGGGNFPDLDMSSSNCTDKDTSKEKNSVVDNKTMQENEGT
jgi:hypothetical protein